MRNNKIVIARIFSAYDGPLDYYLIDRMKMVDTSRFETICIYLKRRSDEPNPLQEQGFNCFYISSCKYFSFFNFFAIFKLASILRGQKVDVAHCNRHQATTYTLIASLFTKVPVILSHVHGQKRANKPRRKLIYMIFGRKISKFLAVSNAVVEDIAQNFTSIKRSQIVVLNNSIDHEYFANAVADRQLLRQQLQIPQDAFIFIAVGRLVPTKGYEYLIEALAGVKKKNPKAHLLVVGQGRERQNLQTLITDADLTAAVTLAGFRKDIPQLLKASDAFILSSLKEGWPLVILEAMAAGIPVVATESGGQVEVIHYGRNGYIVPTANAEKLAQAMLDVMALTSDQRKDMVQKAKNMSHDDFSHEAAVSHLQQIYESELAKKQ